MNWLFVAGGTGGHVFPALAMAEYIRKEYPQDAIQFVGTRAGMESGLLERAGFPLDYVRASRLKGQSILRKLRGLLSLFVGFLDAAKMLRKHKPDIVFGIGGYSSGPLLLLASITGKRTGILEPNAVAGFSNRVLGKWVTKVFVAFEAAKAFFPEGKVHFLGNPIREDILSRQAKPSLRKRILIFGGSQGAHQINALMKDLLPNLKSKANDLSFVHQTGHQDIEDLRSLYEGLGFEATVVPFINEMGEAYAQSDIVIARSGSSVLEVCARGLPSILFPYQYAADQHQSANAKVVEEVGAAFVLEGEDATSEKLQQAVEQLIEDPAVYQKMSKAAGRLRFLNASQDIVEEMRGQK